MPQTDYTDPEITFPRLEVHIRQTDPDAYWLKIWLWKEPGGERNQIVNGKKAGSWRDAHQIIDDCSREHGAEVGEDDILFERPG